MADRGSSWSLEWRIAWRHLRADEVPAWARKTTWAACYALAVGLAFAAWAAFGVSAPDDRELEALLGGQAGPMQQVAGLLGAVLLVGGGFALGFATFARKFSILATIVIFEVLLGCMALVIVLSLMTGLEGDLRDKILAQKAHIRVSGRDGNRITNYDALADAIAASPGIRGASPYLEGEVMIRSGLNRQGAILVGIQPERFATVSEIEKSMVEGSYEFLSRPELVPDSDPLLGGDFGLPPPRPVPAPEADATGEPVPAAGDVRGAGDTKAGDTKAGDTKAGDTTAGGSIGSLEPGRTLPALAPAIDEEGWEDPVEVLDLGAKERLDSPAKQGTPPKADEAVETDRTTAQPERGEGRSKGQGGDGIGARDPTQGDPFAAGEGGEDGDTGWEDPQEVLGLPDLPAPEPTDAPPVDPPDGAGTGASGEPPPATTPNVVLDPVIIGRELSDELAVTVGTRVQLITPIGRMTPAGRMPGVIAARVAGVFFSGMYEFDSKNVYVPMPVAQAFLRAGDRVSGIAVKLDDVERLAEGRAAVQAAVDGAGRGDELVVETWQDLNRNLFSAMFLEKIAMFIALLFVILVASFGILASNLMSVLEKSKEIAILKAMGASDAFVQRVFWAEGLCVGLIGATTGISVGLAFCWALDRWGFPLGDGLYYVDRLPITVDPREVFAVAVAVMAIVWIFSLYPAWVASRLRPVDGLRHGDA